MQADLSDVTNYPPQSMHRIIVKFTAIPGVDVQSATQLAILAVVYGAVLGHFMQIINEEFEYVPLL